MVKLYVRPCFQLLLSLLLAVSAAGQSYIYTDRELFFDAAKEQMKVMLSPDGSTHIWRWGMGIVTMDVYDKQLHLVQNQEVSRRGERLLFIAFKNFYYVLLIEHKGTRLLCVKENEAVDKTADFDKIPLESVFISGIRKGADYWYFIQYSPANDDEHSLMHITAVDSNLQYVNSLHLTVRYTTAQLRQLQIHTLANDLLLMNVGVGDDASKLTIHKVNVVRGTVQSNTFLFQDEMFSPQEVLPYGSGFILQGQAYQPLLPPRRQNAYTYLLQLDSSLKQVNHFYTALKDSGLPENSMYLYLPVSTTVLPHNQLLIADYRRNMNTRSLTFETQLRFHQLDSALTTVNSIVQSTDGYNNYPSFVFSNGSQVMIYYKELIKNRIEVVHSFRFGEGAATDRILQLNPKHVYLLRNAIRTGTASFIMPYLHNAYKLGLVRVNVPEE